MLPAIPFKICHMPRPIITRDRKPVGFLEASESGLFDSPAMFPGLEGNQPGFGAVLEVANNPIAALIFRLEGETIELNNPFLWVSDEEISPDRVGRKAESSRLSNTPSLIDLRGEFRISSEVESFVAIWRMDFDRLSSRGVPSFHLEVDDEEYRSIVRCDFHGMEGYGRGRLHSRFRVSTSEETAEVDFRFDVIGDFPDGFGEGHGHLRSSSESRSGTGEIDFDFDFFGRETGYGRGRGYGRGQFSSFEFLDRLSQALIRSGSADHSVPFQLWIGAVRYSPQLEGVPYALRRNAPTVRDSEMQGKRKKKVPYALRRNVPTVLARALQVLPTRTLQLVCSQFGVPYSASSEAAPELIREVLQHAQAQADGLKQIAVLVHREAPLQGVLQQSITGILKRDAYLTDLLQQTSATTAAEADPHGTTLIPMVVGVNDPDWQPRAVPNFQVLARLGKIIAGTGDLKSIEFLERDDQVLSIDASRSLVTSDCIKSAGFVRAGTIHRSKPPELGDRAIIAIIDSGIDVLHECFQNGAGTSRILAVWDQTDTTGPPPAGFSFGTEHTLVDIDAYIKAGKVNKKVGKVKTNLGRDNYGHGTHVASIAAGKRCGKFAGGMAAEAKIVAVIADRQFEPGSTRSLGYSVSHLAALKYIKDIGKREKLPIVVNMSIGMNSGAHDGTSLLELACDEFCGGGREPGFVVVKSAGNDRKRNGHATVTINNVAEEVLTWSHPAGTAIRDDIELWFGPFNELQLELLSPAGDATSAISTAQPSVVGSFQNGNLFRMSYTRFHKDNGDSVCTVTVEAGTALAIAPGVFKLNNRERG
jgi:hypothetical protein